MFILYTVSTIRYIARYNQENLFKCTKLINRIRDFFNLKTINTIFVFNMHIANMKKKDFHNTPPIKTISFLECSDYILPNSTRMRNSNS